MYRIRNITRAGNLSYNLEIFIITQENERLNKYADIESKFYIKKIFSPGKEGRGKKIKIRKRERKVERELRIVIVIYISSRPYIFRAFSAFAFFFSFCFFFFSFRIPPPKPRSYRIKCHSIFINSRMSNPYNTFHR